MPLKVLPLLLGIAGALALMLWWQTPTAPELEARVPGRDRTHVPPAEPPPDPFEAVSVKTFAGTLADLPGEWPQFRGPRRDGIVHDPTPLATSWPDGGPPVLWQLDLGEGYAGAVVKDGRVLVMDYLRDEQADALRCFSLADGQEIWRLSYPVKIKRNHGMSRTVPTIIDGKVVVMGPLCHVVCADLETGRFLWGVDLVRDFGASVPPWYAGQCPLAVDGRVYLGVGGEALVICLDLETGETLWQSANPKGWKMTHTSLARLVNDHGDRLIYSASGGVAAVERESGDLAWTTDAWKISIAAIATPVVVEPDRVFFSGGYNSGAAMFELTPEPSELYRLRARDFGATQQTPVLYQGHIYAVRPSGELACLDPASGDLLWTSGNDRFGLGPWLVADNAIWVLDDHGQLTTAVATPEGYRRLGQTHLLPDAHEAWGPLAMAGGRLIARDFTRMVCVDVRASP